MTTNQSSTKHEYPEVHTHIALPTSGTQELIDIVETTVQNVCTFFEVDGCSIALLDAEQYKLVTLATSQKQERLTLHKLFLENYDVTSWIAQQSEAIVINNSNLDPRFKQIEPAITGSIVFLPLIDRGVFIGVLTVYRSKTEAFSTYELHLLTIFAAQATLTIINAYQAEQARRDAGHIKAHFISMITHELRSPLNSINGYLDLALEGIAGELNQQQREFVQRARAGSERLYALIEDLLLISRADAGQLRLNRELNSLSGIIANSIEELELIAKDNKISMNIEIGNDFPQIDVDAVRLQQVMRNLIYNALCFTSPGGNVTISARVKNQPIKTTQAESIEANENRQQVEVQIRDTGCGIAPEYQEHIFERFYKIPHAHAGRVSGQGLGLTIVKMIVELHGGRVSVKSMLDAGSTFTFTLPLDL